MTEEGRSTSVLRVIIVELYDSVCILKYYYNSYNLLTKAKKKFSSRSLRFYKINKIIINFYSINLKLIIIYNI